MTAMTRFACAAVLSLLAGSLPLSFASAQPDQHAEGPVLVVFFTDWSGGLDQAARDVIKHAANRAKRIPNAHLVVAGYADSTGTKEADLILTQLRARRVADFLEADGIPASEITLKAEGAQRFHGVASRRVEITISGQ
jgi:outer membrane protein OmpA-like peptidoglycan-associated protein